MGAARAVSAIFHFALKRGEDPKGAIELIRITDIFSIAVALFIFTVGMYDLFIEDMVMPA